jgi:N-succinyldiaminopimelate aminotransferase
MPNPGYQIYEGAALLVGAEPLYLPCCEDTGFLPDLDAPSAAEWSACRLLYLCSPGNPTGAVFDAGYWRRALELAERHDFVIAADECYSEIYLDETAPPVGLLQAVAAAGNRDFTRCVVFHSLSKRSNLPGLRSGFAAGDAGVLAHLLRYRTYHGVTLGPPVQAASAAAWADEAHVRENRDRYRAKFEAVLPILKPVLDVPRPEGAFYLWPALPADTDDETLTRELLTRENLRVVPGRYLGRDAGNGNPGENRLRLSLVASVADCVEAAHRIQRVCELLTRQ